MAALLPGEPLPWNRLKGESGKAYAAFLAYRDQGATRSLAKTSEALQKSGSLIRRWKLQWRWPERAQAWDEHLLTARDEASQAAQVELVTAGVHEIAAMNQRHLAALQDIQQKALLRLAQLDAQDMTPQQAWTWFIEALRLERAVAHELPEEPKGDDADQDAVVRLLSDPDTRRLATQLAQAAGHAEDWAEPA